MAAKSMSLSDMAQLYIAQNLMNAFSKWGEDTADRQNNHEAKNIYNQVGMDGSGIGADGVNGFYNTIGTNAQAGNANTISSTPTQQTGGANLANSGINGYANGVNNTPYFNAGDKYNSGIANLKNQYALAQNTYNMSTDHTEKQAALDRMNQYSAQANALRDEANSLGVPLAQSLQTGSSGTMADYAKERANLANALANNIGSYTGNTYTTPFTGYTPVSGGTGAIGSSNNPMSYGWNQSAAAGNPQVTANNGISSAAPTLNSVTPTLGNTTAMATLNQAVSPNGIGGGANNTYDLGLGKLLGTSL